MGLQYKELKGKGCESLDLTGLSAVEFASLAGCSLAWFM